MLSHSTVLESKLGDNPSWQCLGDVSQLSDGLAGVRFEVQDTTITPPRRVPAFVVQHQGSIYAYLNQCAHVAMEMDWQAGQFFDNDSRYLICASHGALYEPSTGLCVAGPCMGKSLTPVSTHLKERNIYVSTTV